MRVAATLRFLLLLFLVNPGCSHWRRSSEGLLEGALPHDTLSPPGTLGIRTLPVSTKQVRLPSGLWLAVEQAPARGMVGVILTVGAGEADAPKGKHEVAHLVEHLAFRSRPHGAGRPDLFQRLRQLQVSDINGETRAESTTYYAFVPVENLEPVLALWQSVLEDPLRGVSAHDFALEKAIVQNEFREGGNFSSARELGAAVHRALLGKDSAEAQSLLTSLHDIEALTLQDARAFASRSYRHDASSLVIVGDVESAESVLRKLPKAMVVKTETKPAQIEHPQPQPAHDPDSKLQKITADDAPRVLSVAWRLPSLYTSEGHLTKIVTSPTALAFLDEMGVKLLGAESSAAHARHYNHGTLLVWNLSLEPDAPPDGLVVQMKNLVQAFWDPELYKGWVAPLLESKWARRTHWEQGQSMIIVQRAAAASAVFGEESYRDRGLERARFFHATGDSAAASKQASLVARTTHEQLSQFAKQWMNEKQAHAFLLEPGAAQATPPPALVKFEAAAPLAFDLPAEPLATRPPPAALAKITQFRLGNGLEVAIAPSTDFPAITVALAFNGGAAAGDPPGVVELVRSFEKQVYADVGANGLFIHRLDQPDLNVELIRTGPGNLSNALYVLARRLTKVDEELDWRFILAGANDRSQWDVLPSLPAKQRLSQHLVRGLYPSHPYGRIIEQEHINAIDAQQTFDWLLRMQSPRNAMLVIAGDVDTKKAAELADGWFKSWVVGPNTFEVKTRPPSAPLAGKPKETYVYLPVKSSELMRVEMGCRLPNFETNAHGRYQVLANAMQDQLTSVLRLEQGAVYSVVGGTQLLRGGAAHMSFRFSTDARQASEVLQTAKRAWQNLHEPTGWEQTVARGRWLATAQWNNEFADSTEVALEILSAINNRWPVESLSEFPAAVAQVSSADVASDLQVCLANTVIALSAEAPTLRAATGHQGPLPEPIDEF